ncbi:1133_t:CDS:2 [Acaulospora colombiana]|uniref:1133_t:CDS:1 n=1 Tax=Acaulospora colombiana TaxID=27376 RepID=A0ACA9NB93_9GLOM|nr:1133_t:CDS:2 [Acaulospora colombiana]
MEFLSLNRTIITESPPFTKNWTGLNGTWFKRFVQASEELGPVSTAIVEEKARENEGEEIQDEFKPPSKRLKRDEPEKIPESTKDLNVCAILSLRPRHFGKTLFLSTLSSYYDIKNKEQFKQIFGDLYIGKKPTPLATSFLILELNFSKLRTNETYDIFNANFHTNLNMHMSLFMNRYQQELGRYSQVIDVNADALANFLRLTKAVQSSGHKLYVFIDEYDASMIEALRNETIFQDLTNNHKESVFIKSKIVLIESSFRPFYGLLKTACDKGIARVFQTGVIPIVISGFNISADLALREEFWDLYGFKKSDVELLLDNAFGNGDSDDTSIIIKKLLHFPSDPHTLLSQATLNLINNPLGKSILTEALNRCLESKNGIEQRFRLIELAADRIPLLSFLFYTAEFIAEALKIYDWKKEDLMSVRECFQILEGENNIEPLCRFVELALLKPLKDNSVKHANDEALRQAFLDTLILTLHTDIEPEFLVYSQSSNLGEKAIDLVKTSTRRRIAIEFDNIRMEYIKLDGARGSWQEATQVSRSLVSKSEDEILSFEIFLVY